MNFLLEDVLFERGKNEARQWALQMFIGEIFSAKYLKCEWAPHVVGTASPGDAFSSSATQTPW
jgi:hypothetical protein